MSIIVICVNDHISACLGNSFNFLCYQALHFDGKIASGAFGDLYMGIYCGQEVAVKILKDVDSNSQQYQEFMQEVTIMKKVRHKNIVQFIGACTVRPNLCIVFEYMNSGSLYDVVRKEGGLSSSTVVKIALSVARGMNYLHQCHIIHRDLKVCPLSCFICPDFTGS